MRHLWGYDGVFMMALLFIDNCAVNRFAEIGLDPVTALQGTGFEIAITPDLATEYQQGKANPKTPPKTKEALEQLLNVAKPSGFFGFDGPPYAGFDEGVWASPKQIDIIDKVATNTPTRNEIPNKRTDAHLVAIAQDTVVITDDHKPNWKRPPPGQGRVIRWDELKAALAQEGNLADAIAKILSHEASL